MIDVVFDGNKYRYYKSDKGSYWMGIERGSSSRGFYPGNYCRVPLAYWGRLRSIAIENGFSADDFVKKKAQKKVSTKRTTKKAKNVISIF